MADGYNTDIQSLRAGFFKGGGNITVLAENAVIVDVMVDAELT